VFGSYLVSGGSVGPLVEALPFEMWTIGGAAVLVRHGELHARRETHALRVRENHERRGLQETGLHGTAEPDVFPRAAGQHEKATWRWNRTSKNRTKVSAFQKFPKIIANHHACNLICDYLRLVGMNADDPNQIEDVMARELKKTLNEELHPAHALQMMADGLPALGIVAAVLGVIKTMSHIDQPPAILGAMIGSALDRHFSGRAAGPMAWSVRSPSRLQGARRGRAKYFEVIRAVIVTHLHGNAPQVSIESGRKMASPNEHIAQFLLRSSRRSSRSRFRDKPGDATRDHWVRPQSHE